MSIFAAAGRGAREVAIVTVAQAGAALATIAAVKVLTRYLSPAEFGYTAVVTSYVVAAVTVLAAPANGAGMVSFHDAVREGHARSLVGTLFITSMIAAALPLVVLLLPAVPASGLIACGVLYLAAELVKTPATSVPAAARWRRASGALQLADGWGKLVLIAVAASWVTLTARNVIIAYAVNSILIAAIGWLLLFRFTEGGRFFSAEVARATIRSGWFFAGIGAAGWLINLSDRVLLGAFVPAREVGIYVAGYQAAAVLPVGIGGLVMAFVSPILMQWHARQPERAARLLGRTATFIVWLVLPATILAMVKRHLLLRILTSGQYAAAAGVVLWLAPALAFVAVNNVATMAFWMTKRIRSYFVIAIAAGLTNVALNLIFVPRLGYIAAAISTFVTYGVQLVSTVVFGRRAIAWSAGAAELAAIGAGGAVLILTMLLLAGRMPWVVEVLAPLAAYTAASVGTYLFLDGAARGMLLRAVERWRERRA
jgi:O-antigen/teichoic acid export membrane protein